MSNFLAKHSNLWHFTNSGKQKARISFMPEMPTETIYFADEAFVFFSRTYIKNLCADTAFD